LRLACRDDAVEATRAVAIAIGIEVASATLGFKPCASSGVAMPLSNAGKELYRLAMREGHAGEDFSAIYDYLICDDRLKVADSRIF
jgi:hypothetical protein